MSEKPVIPRECSECGSANIEQTNPMIQAGDDETAYMKPTCCLNCEAVWYDIYKFDSRIGDQK